MWPLELDNDDGRPSWLDRLGRTVSIAAVALVALAMLAAAWFATYALGAEIDPRVLRRCAAMPDDATHRACVERVTRTIATFRAAETGRSR